VIACGVSLLVPRLRAARAVPSLAGHVRRGTEREPHLARRDTGLERLLGGAITHIAQHEIAYE